MNNRATGVLVVHSAPRALCSHVEWAVNAIAGVPLRFRWKDQGLASDLMRVEVFWEASAGSAARMASELRGWTDLRFELTEDASAAQLGTHIAHTPDLGLHAGTLDTAGSLVVSEHQVEAILEAAGGDLMAVRDGFDLALGGPWQRELEPYRAAKFDASIRLLRGVG